MTVPRRSFAILTLAAVAAGTACRGPSSQGPPPAPPPTPVALAEARLAPVEDASEYVGTLRSLHSTPIQPQIDGQITSVFVKPGDRVQAGAPPGQIDPRRRQAAGASPEAGPAAPAAAVPLSRPQAPPAPH